MITPANQRSMPPDLDSHNFKTASRQILQFLHKRYGFNLWIITRTEDQDWIVLTSEDHGYGVAEGNVFRWTDSFCSEMVKGNGPRIAPDSNAVPAYATAPIGKLIEIGSYIGVPICRADGDLFGTLCAIDPDKKPDSLVVELPVIEILADLLSTLLQVEMRSQEALRALERTTWEAQRDALTGLYNRRAWDSILDSEEKRAKLFGHPGAVICIDLDGLKQVNDTQGHAAGDAFILHASLAITSVTGDSHVTARLGGDEFGILLVECDPKTAVEIRNKIKASLARHEAPASVGLALRSTLGSFKIAWDLADSIMYRDKRARKGMD